MLKRVISCQHRSFLIHLFVSFRSFLPLFFLASFVLHFSSPFSFLFTTFLLTLYSFSSSLVITLSPSLTRSFSYLHSFEKIFIPSSISLPSFVTIFSPSLPALTPRMPRIHGRPCVPSRDGRPCISCVACIIKPSLYLHSSYSSSSLATSYTHMKVVLCMITHTTTRISECSYIPPRNVLLLVPKNVQTPYNTSLQTLQ